MLMIERFFDLMAATHGVIVNYECFLQFTNEVLCGCMMHSLLLKGYLKVGRQDSGAACMAL